MPVEKVLNRVDFSAQMEIQHALAQHFIVLIRNAAEGVDVNRPRPKMYERLAKMRDVEGQPLPTPDEEEGEPARSADRAASRRVCIDLKPASTALVPRPPRGGRAK
jgi:hypothetical protein